MNATPRSVTTSASAAARQPATVRELLAVFLMIAGAGWNNGQFVQPLATGFGVFADALHALPIALLIWMGLRLADPQPVGNGATVRDGRLGLSLVAGLILLSVIVLIILGLSNPDPNSVGVHSVEDWLPTVVQGSGALLWLGTYIARRRRA